MSGGIFDYNQYKIKEAIEMIDEIITKNKTELTQQEIDEQPWLTDEFLLKYPEQKLKYNYPDNIMLKLIEGKQALERAYIYMHRIDWFLSGDDGEDSFLRRLEEDLNILAS